MSSLSPLLVADLIGIAVFAASGATAAVAKRLDLFGVVFVGFTAALGGGILRDVLSSSPTPKQFHFDFYVDDLADAETRALKLGATKPDHQPGADRYTVLLDPAGHPFCACLRS